MKSFGSPRRRPLIDHPDCHRSQQNAPQGQPMVGIIKVFNDSPDEGEPSADSQKRQCSLKGNKPPTHGITDSIPL